MLSFFIVESLFWVGLLVRRAAACRDAPEPDAVFLFTDALGKYTLLQEFP